MAPRRLGKLREVSNSHGGRSADVDIILVPGIGTSSAETWPFTSNAWLRQILPDGSCRARVLAYEYSCSLDDGFSWEDLLMQGYQLLQEISDARSEQTSNEDTVRPILCVCHSLGGVILKQALCIASEQLHHYEFLVNAVAAIVFLSTPHSAPAKDNTYAQFMNILRATTRKTIKIPSNRNERENSILQGLSTRFEGIFFRTPVLSVYENLETKISDRMFRSKSQKLVDEELCKTHAPIERTIGLTLDHLQMCHFDQLKDSSASQVNDFVSEALQNASELISTRLKALEFTYATMSSYSPTASEVAIKDLDMPIRSTARATNGSSAMEYEVIPITTAIEPTRMKPKLPCMVLESYARNLNFHGREDVINLIDQTLLPSKTKLVASQDSGLRQFALCAMGGMGKTEIAQDFALRHKDEFDAIFWVQADEISKMDESYQQISLKLGLETSSENNSHVVSRELVKGWLSNPWRDDSGNDNRATGSEINWLVIFDNADDPMILTDYWPQGSGAVLVTSRDPLAKSLFSARASGIDLEPLEDDAGAVLLLQLTGISIDDEDDVEDLAKRNAQLLGGVPLAISQMAGIIRRQELSLGEFHDLYTDAAEHLDLYNTKIGDGATKGYAHSISTVWAIEKLKPEARTMLELISFFDADNIQEDLLVEASAEIFPRNITFKNSLYRDLRTELLQTSLVRRNKQKNELSVHRLVQDAVRAKMDSATAQRMFDFAVRLIWVNWPAGMPKPSRAPQYPQPRTANEASKVSRWPLCAQLYPHVLRLHHLHSIMPEIPTLSRLALAALLGEAGLYQNERGRMRDFDGFFDSAIALCEATDHPDRDCLLGNIYHILGTASYEMNDKDESRRCMEKSLELQRKVCDEEGIVDERLAMAYAERGLTKMQDGKYEECITDYEKDREIRESLGTYFPTSKEGNLASAYMALGRLDEADRVLSPAIEKRVERYGELGKESFRTGWLIFALGKLRTLQGRYDESLTAHQKALECIRVTCGESHPRVALVRHKISEHYARLGRYEEAIDLMNEALKTWSQDSDIYKPELARTTFHKAKVLEKLHKDQKAAVAFKVAARLRQELTKEKRAPSTLTTKDFEKLVLPWRG